MPDPDDTKPTTGVRDCVAMMNRYGQRLTDSIQYEHPEINWDVPEKFTEPLSDRYRLLND